MAWGQLARQLAWHERQPDAAFSFTDYLHIEPEGGTHGTCFGFWQASHRHAVPHSYGLVPEAEADLLGTNLVGTSTVLASTRHLRDSGGFSTALPSAEDWDLWLRLAARGAVGCSSMVTTSYLMRPGSETRRRAARIAAMDSIIARYRERPEAAMRAAVRLADARVNQARAELARDEGDSWGALRFELAAVLGAPSLRNVRTAMNGLAHSVITRGVMPRPPAAPHEAVRRELPGDPGGCGEPAACAQTPPDGDPSACRRRRHAPARALGDRRERGQPCAAGPGGTRHPCRAGRAVPAHRDQR